MADIRLGGAYVDFFGRNIRFTNAARQNVAAMQRQQTAIRSLQTQLRGFNRTIDVFTRRFSLLAGIGAGLLIRDIAQLGQTMATVQAITGASTREFDLLTRQVEQLGRQTRFTTVQAAEGQVFLARAGFDVNSIIATLPGTLRLAQVGLIDVGRAADIATNIMLSFGAAADQTGRFVDVLANTSTSSNTNIQQLGDGLKLAGSLAGVLGLSIEQTAAAMGILSNAGLQGTIAGTGLRQIFADLTRLSGPAEDALESLGLTAQDVAVNQTQDLVDAIETLTRAGATAEDIFAIFDVRAATAFVVLQQYVESFKGLEAANLAASGSIISLTEDMNRLGSALQQSERLANTLGIGTSQAAAALRVLSDAGIQATQANAGLTQIFRDLNQLTGTAVVALRDVGLGAQDVSILNSDLVTVVDRIAASGARVEDIFSGQALAVFQAIQSNLGALRTVEAANRAAGDTAASLTGDITRLGDALRLVTPIARFMGISVDQAGAALRVLSDAGVRAETANVGLRQLFLDLARLSGPAEEALRDVGLTAADVSIADSDLVSVINRLATSGARVEDIFSRSSLTIFNAIQSNIDALRDLATANEEATGVAEELARVQDDTLLGAYKRADSAFRGFFIRLDSLTGASEATKDALDSLARTINRLTDGLAENIPRIEFAVRTLLLGLLSSRVLLPAARAVRSLTLQFGFLRSAVLGVTIAVRALLRLTGLLLLVEGIQLAIDFISELNQRIDQTGVSFGIALGVTALRAVEFLLDGITRIPDAFQKVVRITLAVVYESFLTLGDAAIEAFTTGLTGGGIEGATDALLERIGAGADHIRDRVTNIFNDTEGLIPDDSFFNLFDFVDLTNQLADFDLTSEVAKALGLSPEQIAAIDDAALAAAQTAFSNLVTRWQQLLDGLPVPEVPEVPEVQVPEVPEPQTFDRVNNEVVRLTDAGRDLNRTFENFFENVLTGAEGLGDALRQLAEDLRLVALRYLVIRPLLASVLSPARFPGLFEAIPGRQFGGLASGLTIVGERGPELVDFRTQGRVYSNEDTRSLLGGGSPVFAPTINGGGNANELVQVMRETLFPEFVNLTRATIQEENRRRG